ncbi:MAG TPA: WD40 repeat domain-containing protein [Solirubrobacteraceae bacterium]|nr:WD40 repeat domain-containing protein [Solirubrobacteraceae bacterium]
MLVLLYGCGSAQQRRLAHEAKQLRAQVPGLLHSDQRQALLFAVAAQKIDPTVEGKWLLTSADQDFEGVQRVLEPVDPATLTAIRTATTVISSSRGGTVRIWDAKSGELLATKHVKSTIVKFATSYSTDMLASLNAAGRLELWDLSEPRSPLQSTLGQIPDYGGDPVVAIAFAWQDTRLLALTQSGLVYVYDVTAGRRVGVLDLRHASGSLPWSAVDGALSVTAGQVKEEPLTDSASLVVATAQKAVAKIDLGTLRGVTLVSQGQFVATASVVAGGGPGETVMLCTSRGVAFWVPRSHSVEQMWGAPCTGLEAQSDTLTAASAEGTDAVRMGPEGVEESLDHYTGRPARALISGSGGPLEISEDGSISLLEREETGVNLRINEAETSSIAQFDAEGDLLETYGFGEGAEGLMMVEPQSPGTIEGSPLPNRVIRRYRPSTLWWPQGASARWMIDSAELDAEYVVAGGEDPRGAASVLIWDAKTGKPLQRLTTTQSGPANRAAVEATVRPGVTHVALLPGRHLLAAYSARQELIVLWSTETWQQVGAVSVGPIAGFSVNPDESQLLVVSLTYEQSYVESANRVTQLLFINTENAQIERQVGSPNTELAGYIPEEGAGIVAIRQGGQVRVLDSEGKAIRTLSSMFEGGTPQSLAWKPHSQIMAVGIQGGGVRLVDLASGYISQPLRSPPQAEPVNLSFSPNGALLAAGNSEIYPPQSVRSAVPSVWTIEDRHLEQRACRISGGASTAAQWRAWTGGLRYVRACPSPAGYSGQLSGKVLVAEPQLALQHGEEIEAVAASGARAKIGSAEPDSAPTTFAWSKEGTLAWLNGDILHLLEASGKSQEVACACSSVAFADNGVVAVLGRGQALVDFGHSLAHRSEVQTVGLPPYGLMIVGVAKQGVIVAGSEGDGGATGPSSSSLYLVGKSGRARRLASLRGLVYEPGALSPSGDDLAMSEVESSGTCFAPERLGILDLQSGKVSFPAMPAGVSGPRVRDLGWSSSGHLTAQIAPTDCNGSDQPLKDEPEARLYEEQGSRLLARESVGYETQHGASVRAEVQGAVPSVAEGGTLTIVSERGSLLANIAKVSSFSVMP